MSVLCLIANPAEPELSPQIVSAIHAETGGEINWLARSVACEIIAPKSSNAKEAAQSILGELRVDAVLVPRSGRRKKLLIADMDATMINEECVDELAGALGLREQISQITERAMRGELDFAGALDSRVALLKGLTRKTIEEVRREQITLAPGGRVLVQNHEGLRGPYSPGFRGIQFFCRLFRQTHRL